MTQDQKPISPGLAERMAFPLGLDDDGVPFPITDTKAEAGAKELRRRARRKKRKAVD